MLFVGFMCGGDCVVFKFNVFLKFIVVCIKFSGFDIFVILVECLLEVLVSSLIIFLVFCVC